MSNERGPVLRKRGNQPPPKPSSPPVDPAATPASPPDGPSAEQRPRAWGAGGDRAAGTPADRERPGFQRAAAAHSGAGARRTEATGLPIKPASSAPPGRRLYDPRAERGAAPTAPAAGKDWKGGKRPAAGSTRPLISDERTELKTQAVKLAKEKGVPLVHAYRVLKGQTTLNEVLKGMLRKERFEQLVGREGVDRELAGQVAAGHLPKQRAVLLTRMRTLRKQKLHIDGIKAAEVEKKRVGVDLFNHGWMLGRVRAARPYDFDFLAEGSEKSEKLFKHDVKAMCLAEDFEAARRSCEVDEQVKGLGLAQTEDRQQRVRPSDDTMLQFIDDQRVVRFTMRDGEQILGRLRSFGRWDAELVLEGGELVTVFFHGLHLSSLTLGYPA